MTSALGTGRIGRIGPIGPTAVAALAVMVIVVALSLVDGGFGAGALGVATALVWAAVIATAVVAPARIARVPRPLVVASLVLLGLVALTALSFEWARDAGAGFADLVRLSGYAGAFILAGLLFSAHGRPEAPGDRRASGALIGIALASVAVSLLAIVSRLVGFGDDPDLVQALSAAGGRLSYPLGYWNALAALAALGVPVLIWLAAEARRRVPCALAIAGIPVLLLAIYMTSSRGGLAAAVLGAAATIGLVAERRRAAAAAAIGLLGAIPAGVFATGGDGILDAAGNGLGRAEGAVGVALLVGVLICLANGPGLLARVAETRMPRVPPRRAAAAVLLLLGALVLLAGPSSLIGDFRATSAEERSAGEGGILISASGSGRAQFWGTAIDAFSTDPLRGIGAGGYETYWNRNGSLDTATRNAHSEPLELLAEVGIAGFALFAGFVAIVLRAGVAGARQPGGSVAAAALGVVVAGLVGVLIDWTWEFPAVIVPMLIAAALLCRSAQVARPAGVRAPAVAAATLLVGLGVAAIWAGGTLATASNRLDASADALARGDLSAAAAAARSAAAIEPWASEPWLRLAAIEQAAGNYEASLRDAGAAIDRSPDDFRPWLIAYVLQVQLGNVDAAGAYSQRAASLAPLVLPRALSLQAAGRG